QARRLRRGHERVRPAGRCHRGRRGERVRRGHRQWPRAALRSAGSPLRTARGRRAQHARAAPDQPHGRGVARFQRDELRVRGGLRSDPGRGLPEAHVSRGAAFLLLLALAAPASAADRARDRIAAPSAAQRDAPPGTRFDQVIADGSKVNMTITNYGFYGNNYFSRDASLEYPANRGYEQLVRGGLWVGAHAQDDLGEFVGVTTGTVDAAQGATSPGSSEFTPGGREVLRRSTLINSTFFSRQAVSELDVVSDFDDFYPLVADNTGESHRPMRIVVHHENYQWGFGGFQNCLFFHINVK